MSTLYEYILEALDAVETENYDLVTDPLNSLSLAYALGFEHESMYFFDWAEGVDPAANPDAAPDFNHARYSQALVEVSIGNIVLDWSS